MMNAISEFLVDFLFYTMIEGFIFYSAYITYKKIHIDNFILFIFNSLKFSTLFSFTLCILSRILKPGFYQASIVISIIFLVVFFLKENLHVAFILSCEFSFFIIIFEMTTTIILNYFISFNILSYSITDFTRVIYFILIKIFELSAIFIWRVIRMKVLVGTVTRR